MGASFPLFLLLSPPPMDDFGVVVAVVPVVEIDLAVLLDPCIRAMVIVVVPFIPAFEAAMNNNFHQEYNPPKEQPRIKITNARNGNEIFFAVRALRITTCTIFFIFCVCFVFSSDPTPRFLPPFLGGYDVCVRFSYFSMDSISFQSTTMNYRETRKCDCGVAGGWGGCCCCCCFCIKSKP